MFVFDILTFFKTIFISHVDSKVVDDVIEMIKGHFGNITVDRGKTHTFLGMNIRLRDDKKIEIKMVNQLQQCIDLFNEYSYLEITEKVSTPSQKDLRTIDEDSPDLSGLKGNYSTVWWLSCCGL